MARAHEAVAVARRLEEPFSLGFALTWEMIVHAYRRDPDAQRRLAAQVVALGEEHGFPLWVGLGHLYGGAARVATGDVAGLTECMESFPLLAETQQQGAAPGIFFFLADTQKAAGRFVEARSTVGTAFAIAAETGQPAWNAELHRVEGEVLLATGNAGDGIEHLQRAIAIARDQEARLFELRAATSLARLRREQGKSAEARELLAPVYAWFTEGLDTRDLTEAKALLDNLP